jgi:hypothetical protein
MEALTLTVVCREGTPARSCHLPPLTAAAHSQYLLDLLARLPDPRKRRGRRHSLAGLLAVGIAAVTAGSRSVAAIGQWAADAGTGVLAGLGAVRVAGGGVHVPARVRPDQKTGTPGSAAVVEGHLVAVGVGEHESAAERPVDGR